MCILIVVFIISFLSGVSNAIYGGNKLLLLVLSN